MKYSLIAIILISLHGSSMAIAGPFWWKSDCDSYQSPARCKRRCKECCEAPKPVFGYQFGARLEDNPLGELQSERDEVREEIDGLQSQVEELAAKLEDLTRILVESKLGVPAPSPAGDPALND